MLYRKIKGNNLAFTLIELLVAIIVLAIIATITAPTILNAINNSQKEAFRISAIGLAESAREYVMTSDDNRAMNFKIEKGRFIGNGLRVNGDLPKNGIISVNEKMEVQIAVNNGKWCAMKTYEDDEMTINNDLANCFLIEEAPVSCFGYEDIGDGIEINSYYYYDDLDKECPTDLKIPAVIDGKNVISIADDSFEECGLTSLYLPNTIKYIGDWAFMENNIERVSLSNTLESIGNYAFARNLLTSVTIPDSVTSFGYGIFGDNRIEEFTLSDNIEGIPDAMFYYNQLEKLDFPNGITYIGEWAFENNYLTEVVIPDSVTTLGEEAFISNKIKTINIPNGIEEIPSGFLYNNLLERINIPSSVTYIDDEAFGENLYLTLIVFDSPRSYVSTMEYFDTKWGANNAVIVCSGEPIPIYQITSNNDDIIIPSQGVGGSTVIIKSKNDNQMIVSFKLNDVLINGYSFVMPSEDVSITDVTFVATYVIESDHPYKDNYTNTWTKTISGANEVAAYFDARTYIEAGYDFIYIYDKNDNLIGEYYGSELSNQEIVVPGDTIKITLVTDYSVNYWGFKCLVYQKS